MDRNPFFSTCFIVAFNAYMNGWLVFKFESPLLVAIISLVLVLLHEAAHWIIAEKVGIRITDLRGMWLGFRIVPDTETMKDKSPYQIYAMVAAGPVFSALASIVLLVFGKWLHNDVLIDAALYNSIFVVLNMLSLMPLDGGLMQLVAKLAFPAPLGLLLLEFGIYGGLAYIVQNTWFTVFALIEIVGCGWGFIRWIQAGADLENHPYYYLAGTILGTTTVACTLGSIFLLFACILAWL